MNYKILMLISISENVDHKFKVLKMQKIELFNKRYKINCIFNFQSILSFKTFIFLNM